MQYNNTLSSILRSVWLIDPREAMAAGPVIERFLKGENMDPPKGEKTTSSYKTISASHGHTVQYFESFEDAAPGSVAVISISGSLMKNDYCWEDGMATIANRIMEADAADNIEGIVLHIDSPGGTVDGTQHLATTIKQATKPVVSFVDGLMASAAFWIGSAADEVIVSGTTSQIGSIGTMNTFWDYTEYYEKNGVKLHRIFASKSSDKNGTYLEALKGNYKPMQEQLLNPINEEFLKSVKENRPGIAEEALSGKVFLSEKAIELKMADRIGTFQDAVDRCIELANYKTETMFGTKYKGLNAIAKAEENGAEITQEVVNAANAELQESGISTVQLSFAGANPTAEELEQANEALAAAEQERDAAVTAREAAEASLQTLQQEFADFKASAGDSAGRPPKEGTDAIETEPSAEEILASLPHNRKFYEQNQ